MSVHNDHSKWLHRETERGRHKVRGERGGEKDEEVTEMTRKGKARVSKHSVKEAGV